MVLTKQSNQLRRRRQNLIPENESVLYKLHCNSWTEKLKGTIDAELISQMDQFSRKIKE